jgi:hypothetical protein
LTKVKSIIFINVQGCCASKSVPIRPIRFQKKINTAAKAAGTSQQSAHYVSSVLKKYIPKKIRENLCHPSNP